MISFEWVGSLWSLLKVKLLLEVLSNSPKTDSEDVWPLSYERQSVNRTPSWIQENSNWNKKHLDRQMWWNSSGAFFAQLLSSASYSSEAQSVALAFFLDQITSYLGPTGRPTTIHTWKSFMTDDGTPIEFSWDWTTRSSLPKIRYSIEPCGSPDHAGGSSNALSVQSFRDVVVENIPGADFAWFDHFATLIVGKGTSDNEMGLPPNSIFYAFDCIDQGMVAKAYYILKSEKEVNGSVDWAVIARTIYSAPGCSCDNLPAMDTLEAFFQQDLAHFDIEMLAVDLLKPQNSRVKIYFRSRRTSFSSIEQAMTLNGRLKDDATIKGLQALRTLWNELFGVKGDEELPLVVHRTAGILYYVELELGSTVPRVKVYIPVRHYAASDHAVVASLGRYLCNNGAHEKFACYTQALKHSFCEKSMRHQRGLHSYIGCSVNEDGSLRLISYFNPQADKMNF